MLSLVLKQLLFKSLQQRSIANLRTLSSANNMIFHLKHDPITGKSEWVVIDEEEEHQKEHGSSNSGGSDDPSPQATKPAETILSTTSYLDMLNDTPRNRAYRLAIDKTVTEPCHVLDIGAGTGLLSMMAARAMENSNSNGKGMVTACESYLPMFKLTRKVLRANGMEGKIRVINKRSDELELGVDIASRAEVLVSEILDSELLGEGLIPTLQHAHDNLLVENPKTVPYKATIYGQLVECSYLSELHDLVDWETKASDGIRLVPSGTIDLLGVKRQQYAMHCDAMEKEIKLLSEPFKVFEFEFSKRPSSFREVDLQIKATNDGTIHAIISWWLLQLDSEGTIFYSTCPNWIKCPNDIEKLSPSFFSSGNWCDHWKQTVWFTPNRGLSVFEDEEVHLLAAHADTSFSYELKASEHKKGIENCDLHSNLQIALSPERNALYGNSKWRCLMLNAIRKALFQMESPLCLVADDSIFSALSVAHLSKSSHVIPLFPGLGNKGISYLKTVAEANKYSVDRIEIAEKDSLLSTLQDSQRKIGLFIVEPFYYGYDNVLPWQNLRFWKDRTMFDSILSKDAKIIPRKGLLKVSAMHLPDLWRSRCALKDIEGFDHSMVNTSLGACGNLPNAENSPFLPLFLWQCGEAKMLSEIATLMEFDFTKPMSLCSGKSKIQVTDSGICHGFVIWIDWLMNEEDDDGMLVLTGPDKRYWKQAVKLLNKPVEISDDTIEIDASFDPFNGELKITYIL